MDDEAQIKREVRAVRAAAEKADERVPVMLNYEDILVLRCAAEVLEDFIPFTRTRKLSDYLYECFCKGGANQPEMREVTDVMLEDIAKAKPILDQAHDQHPAKVEQRNHLSGLYDDVEES